MIFTCNIEKTADGSSTLYRPDIDEHYHSVKGALAESRHVYLHLGWDQAAVRFKELRIFEVGFGTGLNAALSAQKALLKEIMTSYYSIDLFPLPSDITDNLLPMQQEDLKKSFKLINEAKWDKDILINPFFRLHKINGDFLSHPVPRDINLIYFDAFAPDKQPEMWSKEVFMKLYAASVPGAVLTTYCAKGSIRRLLQATGFETERLPGPSNGKREVLRAVRH